MPELPEVETIRRQLLPLEGARIERARILDPRLTRPVDPEALAEGLTGRRLGRIGRRGKYLLFGLDSDASLLVHLRMTGGLLVADANTPPPARHLRAELAFADGRRLAYTDVRRFGTWALFGEEALQAHLADRLGPEPLDGWPEGRLAATLSRQRRPVLSALLDQRTVAGVGTIYALEALHRAGVDPRRPADGLSTAEAHRLQAAIVSSLEDGIAQGGTSFRDYRRADGSRGGMQERLRVYGRAGEPCLACRSAIARGVIGGRGAAWCPTCQAP